MLLLSLLRDLYFWTGFTTDAIAAFGVIFFIYVFNLNGWTVLDTIVGFGICGILFLAGTATVRYSYRESKVAEV